jgi:uncharacterized damage-inducible protein DinB
METTIAKGLNTALIAELKGEAAKTRKMLALVPVSEKADWAPHAKSMKLGRLALHVAELAGWAGWTITTDELDFSKNYTPTPTPKTTEELLAIHDKKVEESLKALENVTDEELSKPWTLRNGAEIYFTLPKKVVVRDMCYNHIVHHRGQLSVYLRLLNIPIPGMYGPSADEMEAMSK